MDKRVVLVDDETANGFARQSIIISHQVSSGAYLNSEYQVNASQNAGSRQTFIVHSNSKDAEDIPEGDYCPCLFTFQSRSKKKEFKLCIGLRNRQRVMSFECKNLDKNIVVKEIFECPPGGSDIKENQWHSLAFTYSAKNNVRIFREIIFIK